MKHLIPAVELAAKHFADPALEKMSYDEWRRHTANHFAEAQYDVLKTVEENLTGYLLTDHLMIKKLLDECRMVVEVQYGITS